MRLIDADALIEKFNEKCDMVTVLVDEKTAERFHTFCVLADAVEDAPTIDAVPVVWHKVTTRPLTEEEKAYYAEMDFEPEEIFDCQMPEDGQEILIATKWGTDKDICSDDADYGIGLEVRGDWDGVYAWAEMPQYKDAEHEID